MIKTGEKVKMIKDYYDSYTDKTLYAGNSYLLDCHYASSLCFLTEEGEEEIDIPIREAEQYLEFHKRRLFVDMDGTLAEFQYVEYPERLYEKGYFEGLACMKPLVEAINNIILNYPEVEVHILSSVLPDSKYAVKEKEKWLDMCLKIIPKDRRHFPPCGSEKKLVVPGGITKEDILIDDYTKNLLSWAEQGIGIKAINGINHRKQTWEGAAIKVNEESDSWELEEQIINVIKETAITRAVQPGEEKRAKKSFAGR